jgi:hypothetical protein
MEPPFEDNIQLEHLQGYLYAQQSFVNIAHANPGGERWYELMKLEGTDWNKTQLVQLVLDRLQYSGSIEQRHHDFLETAAIYQTVENWKVKLLEVLFQWFDEHDKTAYFPTEEANKNINRLHPRSRIFIDLLQRFIGTEVTVSFFWIANESKKSKDYLSHAMNQHWGLNYILVLLEADKSTYLLHLGHIMY